MDDETGEMMEPMEEIPLKQLGESQLAISAWLTKGRWELITETRGSMAGRNDLLFVENMMWMDEQVLRAG